MDRLKSFIADAASSRFSITKKLHSVWLITPIKEFVCESWCCCTCKQRLYMMGSFLHSNLLFLCIYRVLSLIDSVNEQDNWHIQTLNDTLLFIIVNNILGNPNRIYSFHNLWINSMSVRLWHDGYGWIFVVCAPYIYTTFTIVSFF